jgi:hypothetical protein
MMLLLPVLASRAGAGGNCDPEFVLASASADTIFVEHGNALKNCCLELTVGLTVDAWIVDFREGDVGPECDCVCCFEHGYEGHDFAPGRYLVRVWVGDRLAGEVGVDVEGPGGTGALGEVLQGECLTAVVEPLRRWESWGGVRLGFR